MSGENIYSAITKIMNELGAITKDKKNSQQGFMYRGIDDVMNALNPLLAKYQVFIVPEVLDHIREERQSNKGNTLLYSICKIKYTFYAADGSNIAAVVIGEGMDSGDKATNKAMAIAMKYACFQTFCIPTEDMKDPDAEVHKVKPKASGSKNTNTEIQVNSSNAASDVLCDDCGESVSQAVVGFCQNYSERFKDRIVCSACQKKYPK